jgi:hypothetical protein
MNKIFFKDINTLINMNTHYDNIMKQLKQFSTYDKNGNFIQFQRDAILQTTPPNKKLKIIFIKND